MARFKLTIEYEGTRYRGWQAQKGQRTVQGEFFSVFDKIFEGKNIEFYGAGRTDSGVHALAQVAHLGVDVNIPLQTLQYRINDLLPPDIHVLSVEKALPHFHARYDAVARSYVYLISKRRTAFEKQHCWWIKDPLDVETMKQAASLFAGMHDFASFTDPLPDKESTRVEVRFAEVYNQPESIAVHITGSHFLWKMVRRMVGVLVEVGRGNFSERSVEGFLKEKSQQPAPFTAPSSGLFLHRIYYPGDEILQGETVLPRLLNFR